MKSDGGAADVGHFKFEFCYSTSHETMGEVGTAQHARTRSIYDLRRMRPACPLDYAFTVTFHAIGSTSDINMYRTTSKHQQVRMLHKEGTASRGWRPANATAFASNMEISLGRGHTLFKVRSIAQRVIGEPQICDPESITNEHGLDV